MPRFVVHLTQVVSTAVDVDAEDYAEALELVWDSEDMPGSMCYGAFGQASVDEAGEWHAVAVYDENNVEVWTGDSDD